MVEVTRTFTVADLSEVWVLGQHPGERPSLYSSRCRHIERRRVGAARGVLVTAYPGEVFYGKSHM